MKVCLDFLSLAGSELAAENSLWASETETDGLFRSRHPFRPCVIFGRILCPCGLLFRLGRPPPPGTGCVKTPDILTVTKDYCAGRILRVAL